MAMAIQLNADVFRFTLSCHTQGMFVVIGAGNDSILWSSIFGSANVFILENNQDWVDKIRIEVDNILKVDQCVSANSQLHDSIEIHHYLKSHPKDLKRLISYVKSCPYQEYLTKLNPSTILVDSPLGGYESPLELSSNPGTGRFQVIISSALHLSKIGGWLLIDDYQRALESLALHAIKMLIQECIVLSHNTVAVKILSLKH